MEVFNIRARWRTVIYGGDEAGDPLGTSSSHSSGRCVSYWNAFLLNLTAYWNLVLFSTIGSYESPFSFPCHTLLDNNLVASRFDPTPCEALFPPDHPTRTQRCTDTKKSNWLNTTCTVQLQRKAWYL